MRWGWAVALALSGLIAMIFALRPRSPDANPSEILRLRSLQINPLEEGVELRDLLQISKPLHLTAENAALLDLINGRTLEDGVRAVVEGMSALDAADWERRACELARRLDEGLMLDNARFRAALEAERDAFRKAPVRRSRLDGIDPVALRRSLHGEAGSPRAIIAPHIDYGRGSSTYGKAYGQVRGGNYRRVVILGTSHLPTPGWFVLCRKAFETPLGTCPFDTDFASRLSRGFRFPDDEFLHRSEHSIELQLPYLQASLGRDVPIVPILCGSLESYFEARRLPDAAELDDFVRALRAAIESSEGRTLIVAASDFSHVGPRFGDAAMPDLAAVESADRLILRAAAQGDAHGAFNFAALDANRRRICGMAPVYVLLKTLGTARGRILEYRQCASPSQCVTVAAIVFD